MYRDRLAEQGESKLAARRHVGSLLDLNPATLRNWVEDAERADGHPGAAGGVAGGGVRGGAGAEEAGGRAGARERHPQDRVRVFRQAELDRRLK